MRRLTSYTHDGLVFDVVDDGPADGTPIVLLHGFPQNARQWERLTPHLHARGYRTIAPDQRGYAPGARPRGRYAYRVLALAGDTAALIEALGCGPVHLVGHDWGSIAFRAAAAPRLRRYATALSGLDDEQWDRLLREIVDGGALHYGLQCAVVPGHADRRPEASAPRADAGSPKAPIRVDRGLRWYC